MLSFLFVLTWEEGDKFIQELHAFVATLRLRSATLFQKPHDHVGQTQLVSRWKSPEGDNTANVCEMED